MDNVDRFFIIIVFLGYVSVNLSNQHEELEKKVDLIIENQK